MTSSTNSNDNSSTSSSSSEDESSSPHHDPASEKKKIRKNEDEDEADNDDNNDSDEDKSDDENNNDNEKEDEDGDENEDKAKKEKKSMKKKKKKKKIHRLSLTETENFNEKLKKRGVLYIARIPPKLTPTKIKSLLSEFGCEVTRVYLVEEDATKRKRRKKEYGRSGGKRYVEGWVEMSNKKKAKLVALQLNNTPISNHKRNPHYGDLWNLKYLPKFQWSHLTEKVAYERRVREQKLRIEMMHSRRENAAYVEMVETGKKLDIIESRRRTKRKQLDDEGDDDDNKQQHNSKKKKQNINIRRHKHHQTKPLHDGSDKSARKALLGGLV